MNIRAASKTYEVRMEKDFGFFDALLADPDAFFAVDRVVYALYVDRLFRGIPEDRLFLLDAIEENKTLDTAMALCEAMTELPAKRNAHLISVGGGITQDVTGFSANVLYRGIRWTYVPTTLLAACDSCIGGKTSLNYKRFKNLLGTFFPPDRVHIVPAFFDTLSDKDFKSGLGEVVKFNLMDGTEGLDRIERRIEVLVSRDAETLAEAVLNSLAFKKPYIEEDEFDRGVRIHLNFAHTFGHAFETVTRYAIPHGTAVALGMCVADRISLLRGRMSAERVARIEAVLRRIIPPELVPAAVDAGEVLAAIRKDKKQVDANLTGVLLDEDMKLEIVRDLQPAEVERAFADVLTALREVIPS